MKLLYSSIIYLVLHPIYSQSIIWQDSLTTARIYLQIAQDEFDDHPHRSSQAFDIKEAPEKHHEAIIKTFKTALRKYPAHLIHEHVAKIYVYDQFYKGNTARGTYIGRHGFFFAVPYIDDAVDSLDLERLIHHEISHRLLLFNYKPFDFKRGKVTMK